MHNDGSNLLTLAGYFALMSLFAVGGANAALPEMHRLAVDVMHWMTDRQFADLYAIAQVTPGPNVIVVTLIGYHVAGLAGALVATLAMCGPTCVFAFFVGQVWDRFKEARWRLIIQAALVPISLGGVLDVGEWMRVARELGSVLPGANDQEVEFGLRVFVDGNEGEPGRIMRWLLRQAPRAQA